MSRLLIDIDEIIINDEPEIEIAEEEGQTLDAIDLSHIDRLTVCPRCRKPLVPSKAISGTESTFFLECPACGTLINTFKPLPHQAEFMSHPAKYKMTAGGYGSGKSAIDIQYVLKHLFLIPKARVCVCGRSYPALESTFLEEFKNIFPDKLLKSKNDQKKEYVFTNGAVLMLRSFDDPTKLKSMNLTLVVIIEASDVPESGFEMMKSRLRNTAALIPELDLNGNPVMYYDAASKTRKIKYRVDARHILMETNPASNWVKKFLTESKDVRYHGSAKNEGYVFRNINDNYFTQIVSTDSNPYLPENYVEELSKGRSPAWVAQFLKGSFNFNENLVFPNVGLRVVHPHPLPDAYDSRGNRALFFAIGLDYGIVDHTHIVYTAYSTITKKLYVYDELRINNADVKTIVKEYRKNTKINGTDLDHLLMLPRFDGRSYNKRESDLNTIGGAFEANGLFFEPSFAGHDIRIIKLNSLINHDQIEIYSTCEYLIEELLNYTFILDKEGKPTKTPKDGKDHGITALEFVVAELPHNLQELKLNAYIPQGSKHVHDRLVVTKPTVKPKIYNPLEVNNDSTTNNQYYTSTSNYYRAINGEVFETEEDFEGSGCILGAYTPGGY